MTPLPAAALEPDLPVLYSFRRCPYAIRARLAIAASGLTCALREVDLRNKPQALLDTSPKGTVPVLITLDGRVLDQSLDIMLWALKQHDPERWLAPETGSIESMQTLIAQCDGDFKQHLDRYKYPDRYKDTKIGERKDLGAQTSQAAGAKFLLQLNARLAIGGYLFGCRAAWADMAIAPFVRQFADTDREWFDRQPWPRLLHWLSAWQSSDLFKRTMDKYPPWISGDVGTRFP
ncbi:MAG: glutathione S-transferase [Polaromonas sp.]|uniref:glutathione S-transferase n=1 Tax=Polaromonas sp. TaxID=1869339 RepID=UPI00179209CB|nr:glutathione S-transferase [Polaromonas sp.]NMM09843.1 glutathione S-transferase [Polaromonas sp.]